MVGGHLRRAVSSFFPGHLFFLLLALSAVVAFCDLALAKPDQTDSRDIKVETRQITTFHRGGLSNSRFGKLEFVGGLVLSSPDRVFGGWSDLAVDPDGQRFLAISDDGRWLRAAFRYQGKKLVGIHDARVGRLRALSGRFLEGKREKDAEGLSLVSGTLSDGDLLISFERIHRVGRFRVTPTGVFGPSAYLKLPKVVKRFSRNKGLEGVGVLRAGAKKGKVIVIGERPRGGSGNRQGFVLGARPFGFFLKDMGDMDATSIAVLPGGDVLFLERRYHWAEGVSMRIRRVAGGQIKPGAVVVGEVLITANFASEIDNMEGLAVHRTVAGETVLSMISDDNFNRGLQRTLLLQFVLRDESLRRAKKQ